MLDYSFVRQDATSGYQELVHHKARQGWRLVQVLVEQPAVMVSEYVVIFERPSAQAFPPAGEAGDLGG